MEKLTSAFAIKIIGKVACTDEDILFAISIFSSVVSFNKESKLDKATYCRLH